LNEAEQKALAEAEAVNRAERIIGEYERWHENCPGCGGFVSWAGVDNDGFV
jgi:hypothetical protein